MQIQPAKKMLLHMCCGPCGVFPVKYLKENYPQYDITGYFYNPNIHPYKEFLKRLEALELFSQKVGLELIVAQNYDLEEFLTQAVAAGKTEERCRGCYEIRLRKVAALGREKGFDLFTSTLLVSPYQKHDLIREVGLKIAREEGIEFCYIDFRPGWQEGVDESRRYGLYRQPYCGCIFSEKERYYKVGK